MKNLTIIKYKKVKEIFLTIVALMHFKESKATFSENCRISEESEDFRISEESEEPQLRRSASDVTDRVLGMEKLSMDEEKKAVVIKRSR